MNLKRKAIVERLKLAREFAGLSQSQVAKLLKLHRPAISEIEAGRRKVTAEEISQLANIYNVDLNWLLGNDMESQDEYLDRIHLAARELSKLKPEDLDDLMKLLKILKKSSE